MPASSTGAYSDVSTVILEDFDIIEQIHHGRCTVYRAKCNKGRLRNRQLALKKVPVPRSSSSGSTACWETLHQALCHPNIASLYSTFSTNVANHQVLELCPSGSLDDYMRAQGSQVVEESKLRKLLKGLFDALGYLRTQRVVHRGIDMSSILLTDMHTAKLSDFKNAIRLPEYEDMTDNPVQHVTAFSAPEIKKILVHGFSVDMWSAGCVALACSIKASDIGVIPRSARVDFKGNLSKMTPSEFKDLIHGLLQYEPADRLSVSEACSHAYFTSDCTRRSEFANSQAYTLPRSSGSGSLKFKQLATISNRPGIATMRTSLKDILSDACNINARNPLSKTNERRVFSDPVKSTSLERGGMLPPRSKSVSIGSSTKYAKVIGPAATKQAIPIGTVRPSPFTTSSLHPRTHKAAYGQLTILPSRSVLVDFREGQRRKGCKGDEVLVISPTGSEVKIFKAPHLSVPCCLIEPNQEYTLQDIPSIYWDQYNKAAEHIDQIKRKTPKLVEYGAGIKYTLMANNPLADVEVIFDSFWLGDSDGLSSQNKCQPKMRLSLSNKRSSLEIARHMVNGDAEEWTKKILTAYHNSLYVASEREFFQLEPIEQKAIHELTKFLAVCVSVENTVEEAETHGGIGSSAAPIISGETNVTFSSSLEVEHSDMLNSCDTNATQKIGNSTASQVSGTVATTGQQNASTTFIPSPMQTRFLASVGWCMRYRTCEIPQSERYQMLFLDGVIMEVDVDHEKVNYTAIDGTKESCSVHDCIFKQDIFKRMQSFESFVALFEYDS